MRGMVKDRLVLAFRRYFGAASTPTLTNVGRHLWRAEDAATGAWAEYDTSAWRVRRVSESGPGKEGQKQ